MAGLDPAIHVKGILRLGARGLCGAAMDFIKFLVLSIAAFVLFFYAGMYSDHLGTDGVYHSDPVIEASAVLLAGIVFCLVPPRHLKFGFAVWIFAAIILYVGMRIELEYELRAYPDDPNINMAGIGAGFLWLGSVLAVNPICYFLGKYIWKRAAGLRGGEVDGRVKPGHDIQS